ncbi:hypothetical protein F0562_007200 [Nyssa sinensis]|uniref:CRC domain-containing protein n=1 Tax=Nyssa sinensis TaxID=561372 RepID=A0A5J5A6B1_9ASTE|nr:hypothetical protein F0562_007200 [Nyssa sinensis]
MDSLETDKMTTTTTTSTSSLDSVAIQDSTIFNYISNLSPIKPVKAAPVAPGFPGLSSPPVVFTSPRVNPFRERSYPKRLQYPHSFSPEVSRQDDRGKKIATGSDISGKSNTQLNSGFIPYTEKESDNKSSVQDQDGSSAGCVDEYLTETAGVEFADSARSANLSSKQSDDVPQSLNGFNDWKESISRHYNKNNVRKDADKPVGAFHTILEQAEDLQGKSSFDDIKTVDTNGKQGSGEIPCCVCPNFESNLSTGHAHVGQHCEHSVAQLQHAGGGCKDDLDCTRQFQPEILHIIQEYEDCGETTGTVSKEPVENVMLLDPKASIAANSSTSQSPHIVKPLNNPALLKPTDCQATPNHKRKSYLDSVEELNQSNPKRGRKKASGTSDGDGDGDGCKRCNCKKTKCLKLYCDCFAGGIYCAEPCACQECFNRPEYEDTVLETRQQIESRNPLAFAPKIVQSVSKSPANSSRERNCLTSSSTKHKRGCNCKKSMCLKKYCECYQANVGCSDGCRCEGCKNVYGRKEEYGMTKDVVNKQSTDERLEDAFDEKLKMVASRNSFFQIEQCNPHNLTPLTPSFQCSDHRNDASKSQFPSRRYILSPESDLASLPPYRKSSESPRNSNYHDLLIQTRKDILDVVSCHQELDYDSAETGGEFSQRCDVLANIHHLTSLPDPPSMAKASSMSSKTMDWTNVSRGQLCPGSGHSSSVSSLCWRSSPITPMTQFGGAKLLQVLDSDDRLYDILEDDIPEILKDTPTHFNAMKGSSPNKKRVSPPHSCLHELGSSSSASLRSRQLILQAMPPFPPLTPCIDSKEGTNHNIEDSQDDSSNM